MSFRVLIVEDNPKALRGYADALGPMSEFPLDVSIDLAQTGEMAERRLQTAVYDLVLLDEDLPGISGSQVVKRLRAGDYGADKSHVPVLFVTGYSSIPGISEILEKPFSPDVLRGRVFGMLRGAKDRATPLASHGEFTDLG